MGMNRRWHAHTCTGLPLRTAGPRRAADRRSVGRDDDGGGRAQIHPHGALAHHRRVVLWARREARRQWPGFRDSARSWRWLGHARRPPGHPAGRTGLAHNRPITLFVERPCSRRVGPQAISPFLMSIRSERERCHAPRFASPPICRSYPRRALRGLSCSLRNASIAVVTGGRRDVQTDVRPDH
jgi:hypothetical protein